MVSVPFLELTVLTSFSIVSLLRVARTIERNQLFTELDLFGREILVLSDELKRAGIYGMTYAYIHR